MLEKHILRIKLAIQAFNENKITITTRTKISRKGYGNRKPSRIEYICVLCSDGHLQIFFSPVKNKSTQTSKYNAH